MNMIQQLVAWVLSLWQQFEKLLRDLFGGSVPTHVTTVFLFAVTCTIGWAVATAASRVFKVLVVVAWVLFIMLVGLTLLRIV